MSSERSTVQLGETGTKNHSEMSDIAQDLCGRVGGVFEVAKEDRNSPGRPTESTHLNLSETETPTKEHTRLAPRSLDTRSRCAALLHMSSSNWS